MSPVLNENTESVPQKFAAACISLEQQRLAEINQAISDLEGQRAKQIELITYLQEKYAQLGELGR
jgi:hypothetical protein